MKRVFLKSSLDILTFCKHTIDMIMELLGHEDYLRILLALHKKGGLRFGQIENLLDLNPARIDRALKFLFKGFWINTHTLQTEKGRKQTEYRLKRRGVAFLEAFTAFTKDIHQRKNELGPAEVAKFQGLYRSDGRTADKLNAGKIARVIKIGPIHNNEKETITNYRTGCLRLSPNKRISEMRAHSRRMILLNPNNPRSPHIARRSIRIIHDAI